MKPLVFVTAAFAVGVVFFATARPAFVPAGAYFRIDRHNATPAQHTGEWIEMSYLPGQDGDWGQGQCQPSSKNECHLWDWVTWWNLGAAPPAPGSGFTPVEYGSALFPAGYNPSTGEYYY